MNDNKTTPEKRDCFEHLEDPLSVMRGLVHVILVELALIAIGFLVYASGWGRGR
jgi:hypothetical protein